MSISSKLYSGSASDGKFGNDQPSEIGCNAVATGCARAASDPHDVSETAATLSASSQPHRRRAVDDDRKQTDLTATIEVCYNFYYYDKSSFSKVFNTSCSVHVDVRLLLVI